MIIILQTRSGLEMKIRCAREEDMGGINSLLCQVLMVHHNGRPDLFKNPDSRKRDDEFSPHLAELPEFY